LADQRGGAGPGSGVSAYPLVHGERRAPDRIFTPVPRAAGIPPTENERATRAIPAGISRARSQPVRVLKKTRGHEGLVLIPALHVQESSIKRFPGELSRV